MIEKKILYIIPPYFSINTSDISLNIPSSTVPYGILSIDSFMKENIKNINLHTKVIDLNIEIFKSKNNQSNHLLDILTFTVHQFNPDIVAISALFNTSYNYLKPISDIIKKVNCSCLIIAGGGLPTNLYKKILDECPNIDAICYGEGEIPMTDLLNSNNYIRLIEEHQSWINRNSIKLRKEPSNSFVYNLDEIPEFDYSTINLNNYNLRSIDKFYTNQFKREISIHTSRGCPFDCVFCANGKLHGKEVRYMSVNKVINEVKSMISKYNITNLMIEDDHFLSDTNRAKEILKQLSKLDIKIEFPNGIAIYAIDEELAKLMKEANVTTVALAMESGSNYVLQKLMHKPLKVSMIKSKVEMLRKNNINIHAFIIFGIPGETDEHRLETINNIKRIGFDWIHIVNAIPVVGSKLYDICVRNNYIIDNNMSNHIITKAVIKAPGIDPEKIEKFIYQSNLSLNFVNNYNMSLDTYEGYYKASMYFTKIIQKYPQHAFAHYYLAKTLRKLYRENSYYNTEIIYNLSKFHKIINEDKTWREYAEYFNIY